MKKKYNTANNLVVLKNMQKFDEDKNAQEDLFDEFLDILYRCLLKNGKAKTEAEYQYFIFKNQRIIKSLLWELGFDQRF